MLSLSGDSVRDYAANVAKFMYTDGEQLKYMFSPKKNDGKTRREFPTRSRKEKIKGILVFW